MVRLGPCLGLQGDEVVKVEMTSETTTIKHSDNVSLQATGYHGNSTFATSFRRCLPTRGHRGVRGVRQVFRVTVLAIAGCSSS